MDPAVDILSAAESGVIDVTLGGLITLREGTIIVKPNPERVFLIVARNGAMIESIVHGQAPEGEHYSDRIRLLATTRDGNERGWLMNDLDAHAIIQALTVALEEYNRPESNA